MTEGIRILVVDDDPAMVGAIIGGASDFLGAALIIVLSVMNGFQADIQRKIIGAQAHVTVFGAGSETELARIEAAAKAEAGVAATAPFVLGQAILTSHDRSLGVLLKGLDPAREFAVNDLAMKLVDGSWDGIRGGKIPGIVIGIGFLLSLIFSQFLTIIIGLVLGLILVGLASYLFAYIEVFGQTVWTLTYIELSKLKELDVIEVK